MKASSSRTFPMRLTVGERTAEEAPVYYGSMQVGDLDPLDVDITALGDEPIIGRGITDQYRIILDHGARVIVEP